MGLQYLVDGLLLGGVYALLAAGLAMIFGIMRVINFAQGEFMMLGMYAAYFGYTVLGLDPYLVALPAGLMILALGIVVATGLIERIPRGDQDAQLLLTLGLSLVLQNLAIAIFGVTPHALLRPYSNTLIAVGPLFVHESWLFACVASLVVMLGLYLFLSRTWTGRALRATADDASAATYVGISVRRMHSIAFGIGVGLAGLAGTLIATFHAVLPTVGQDFVLIMFVAVVLGGLGSIPGAVLGAIFVGVVQSVSAAFVPLQLQNAVVFLLFVVVLLVRPRGLFGLRVRV
ncbi:MAG: branched-chain amino acid ABC transporter permease [Candidatus Dormibacteraeota bacterium]|uniref:Branched-chain amino acid ABC transporter permease n=2 Tax=Candidatus Dormibacteria TaxID=3126996 RepID=A0A934N5H1_9BACT|nr:branched-chain amino acid ABC transporter permease [Candidatus Dormibacteraeota bacterium]MBJ7603949.1 branched-chain amino acid ABC transporter permease [Candidatus Dormibacteraeota bacterium]MBJ7607172.1 branched-chain amino acid ABC transporter permease [Candidatus Dormibacteraeota bacterium]